MNNFEKPVKNVKGVGPKISSMLNKLNIFSVEDLITHFPRLYEDRSNMKPINELEEGEEAAIIGEVSIIDRGRYTRTGKHVTRIIIKNKTGFAAAVWYNQKFLKNNFTVGDTYIFYGKIARFLGETQIINPEYEKLENESYQSILPVYSTTKNLSQKMFRRIMYGVINSEEIKIDETLPEAIRKKYVLPEVNYALKSVHFPKSQDERFLGEKRIKFEELLVLQLGLMLEKNRIYNQKNGIKFEISNELKTFVSELPFKLTNAQKRTINEILNDMKSDRPMNRLVQGDVGSGKTIVAAAAMFNGVKNGYQAVLMAPTEILASQHYDSLRELFGKYDIKVGYLSGSLGRKDKDSIKNYIKEGKIDVVVGTHALLQGDVEFKALGLVITDEQHRFGVRQRAIINHKGENPDVLVMTATPIPRTMALFIYGDLDISIIDELPPGRQKIDTYCVKPSMRERIYNFVKNEIKKGRQAYVVCPVIDESDVLDVEAATALAEKLKADYLSDVNVGLIHGKMKPAQKDSIMEYFRDGRIDVLVSTTVIEVGVDVPNATLMVIENADRFGLAQLHQLRGRVGRGEYKSYCILVSDMKTDIAMQRMKVMTSMSDGFKIAEEDMKIRGTGEFFGLRQHGLPELKLADILSDTEILRTTNTLAKELIASGSIYSPEYAKLREKIDRNFKEKAGDIAFN